MNVSFRQLRAFTTISRLGSFVEAARAMHVTPAALSVVIRDLEETLGFRLFDRTTRRVDLSEVGRQYFQYAEQVLLDLRKAELFAQDVAQRKTGLVRLATTQVVTWVLLPPAFAAFNKKWPDIRLEPIDIPTDQIISAVEGGQADLAINLERPVADNIEALPLFQSRQYLICTSRHRFARRKSVRWDELANEPIIVVGRGAELRIRSELPPGLVLQMRHEAANTSTALALAASGAGSVICAGYVKPLSRMHDLRSIPLCEPTMVRRFTLYRNRARSTTPAVREHQAFLLDYFARTGAGFIEDTLTPRWSPG
jgi:DNA-binding transcriptional LysR family regulator